MPTVPSRRSKRTRVLTKKLDVRTPIENADGRLRPRERSARTCSSPFAYPGCFFLQQRGSARRFAGMDSALRSNLTEGLADGLDDAILSGTNGLFSWQPTLTNNAQTTNDTFDSYLNPICAGIRLTGRYAATWLPTWQWWSEPRHSKIWAKPTGTPAWTGAPLTGSWS